MCLWDSTGFVTCDSLLMRVQSIICCANELTNNAHVVVTLFLYQNSWYNMLADAWHL